MLPQGPFIQARVPASISQDLLVAKFLLLIALGIVVYLIVSRMRREGQPPSAPRQPRAKELPEDMVRCSHCGVHLPRSESFTSRGRYYCTDEHRRLAQQQN
jgi:uncharacterized protein